MSAEVKEILEQMDSISLEEMREVQLMDRLDSKYVANAALLPELLKKMVSHFRVQDVNGIRISAYSTQYLDTPELTTYLKHHNRVLNRQKYRIRSYVDSNLSFLEVKNKSNKGRTVKTRVPIHVSHVENIEELNEGVSFLSELSDLDVESLSPSLANRFNRITFVNKELTERITIDTEIQFQNYFTGIERYYEDLMIIELKQDGNATSFFHELLLDLRIKKTKISKYCIGMVMTDPNCKYNRFKRKKRLVNKLINIHTDDSN